VEPSSLPSKVPSPTSRPPTFPTSFPVSASLSLFPVRRSSSLLAELPLTVSLLQTESACTSTVVAWPLSLRVSPVSRAVLLARSPSRRRRSSSSRLSALRATPSHLHCHSMFLHSVFFPCCLSFTLSYLYHPGPCHSRTHSLKGPRQALQSLGALE
jgi:hypothetical protein